MGFFSPIFFIFFTENCLDIQAAAFGSAIRTGSYASVYVCVCEFRLIAYRRNLSFGKSAHSIKLLNGQFNGH